MQLEKDFQIYCAGPLFNKKEKEEMQDIATTLEENGFRVFLPHRDGFEFAHLSNFFKKIANIDEQEWNRLLQKAIFTLDVYQVLNSDGLILNINGRVPDEGATVEAGIAWNAGKCVVIYKNDDRALFPNGTDNPLLIGLSDFIIVKEIKNIPGVFQDLLKSIKMNKQNIIDNERVLQSYDTGKILSELIQDKDKNKVCHELIKLLGKG